MQSGELSALRPTMREIHCEQDDAIQAFLKWHESSKMRQPGLNGSNHESPCHYITISEVKRYLETPGRVEALLQSVFRNGTSIPEDADLIRQHYLRSLAILLLIGRGSMIHQFARHDSLQDRCLPHRSRPIDFPSSSDPSFFEDFSENQWQFCAKDLEYNMHRYAHKEDILPITNKAEIGKGGNAVIFRFNVHEEYNKLVPDRWEMPKRPPHLQQTFVLKTYRGRDAKEQHDAEREAFLRLRYNIKPSPYVIAYYGSFYDDDTYNIILEFADRGNLNEYMEFTPEPPNREDMIECWDRICLITHGLAHIHGLEGSESLGKSVLLGWHQDIKPANILVFSGSGTSNYDVYFKIADLSLCHFRHSESSQHGDSDLDISGTRAYGAPETFKPDDKITNFPIQVRRDVDIWSTGCVFSEAAVWSRFGWSWVLEYRHRRKAEVKDRQGLGGEQIFHDGRYLLQTVHDMHKQISEDPREMDLVTVDILRLLNEDMLLSEDKVRNSAKNVFQKSRSIINKARKISRISTTNISATTDKIHENFDDLEGSPKTPPNVPPGYVRGSSPSSWRSASIPADMFPSARLTSTSNTGSYSPSLTGIAPPRQQVYTISHPDGYSQRSAHFFGPFPSGSFGLDELPDPPSPGSIKSYGSSFDKFNGLSLSTSDHETPQGDQRPHSKTIDDVRNRAGLLASNEPSLHRSQTEKGVSGHRQTNAFGFTGEPRSLVQETRMLTSAPSSSLQSRRPKSYLEAGDPPSSRSGFNGILGSPQRPVVSLKEALEWKQRKKDKKQGYQAELTGHENLTSLDKRDHIFVVDNSKSMRPHRKEVVDVVSVLGYILKATDDDGLDICFTQSTETKNSGKATKLSDVVEKVAFKGISDMRTRFSRILRNYEDKFGTTTASSRSWYRRNGSPVPQKPLSFYVLTDGKWNPNEVGPIIKSLVDSMREFKLHKDHVGIQFIRFGQDPNGIARLNHLDHGLGLKKIDMDIVDTTAWDGNVWKQLLGAISPWYDDDPD